MTTYTDPRPRKRYMVGYTIGEAFRALHYTLPALLLLIVLAAYRVG